MKFVFPFMFITCIAVFGQLHEFPLRQPSFKIIPLKAARVQSLTPLPLPYWDDFSFSNAPGYANDTLWEVSKSVWINNGLGIDPPSRQVATFDGVDSLGKPYSVTDLLAKGFSDRLISRSIRLDLVPPLERPSVFFSFYFQVKGRGETPDKDDNLSLWFKDITGTWQKVFEVANSQLLDPTKFYPVILPVSNDMFFHAGFQFRFQNFARLSGPYDMWHVDYIYLNKGRSLTDFSMPDRTISSPMSSIIGQYTCIPLTHYKDTFATITTLPKIKLFGLLENNLQPFRYTTEATVFMNMTPAAITKKFFIEKDVGPINPQTGAAEIINPFQILDLTIMKSFPGDSLNFGADSVHINFKFGLDSEDSNPIVYLPQYQPINFLHNDTITTEFVLSSFYARDDGGAEFGAGLNQPGAELAYEFNMLSKKQDTVVAVDIYFPEFGDQSNQTLTLKLWNTTGTGPLTQIHQQTISVIRSTQNKFVRYRLTNPVVVFRNFFVGWKQNSSAIIPAGFDKNNDSASKIYFNTTGVWEQNVNAIGSLMIRPVFGKGNGALVTAVRESVISHPYPNPNQGVFYLSPRAEQVQIFNQLGEIQIFDNEAGFENRKITLSYPSSGILIVRWLEDGQFHSAKVVLKKN